MGRRTRSLAWAAVLMMVSAAGVVATQQGAVAAGDPAPSPVSTWRLMVDGVGMATSSSCSGFGSRTEVQEYRSGAEGSQTVQKIGGNLEYTDVTCSFPLDAPRSLYDWRALVEAGDIDAARKNVSFELVDNAGSVVQSWRLFQSWPSQYLMGPDRTVLVLTHERAVRQP